MNILMALSQLELTGAEIYAVTIGEELSKRGNKVCIVSDTLTTRTDLKYYKINFNKRNFLNRIKHIIKLYKIIKAEEINIVHAHSRASSWSAQIACFLSGIPLITTTHGKQPVHTSRKIIKALGAHSIAVCENIKKQLIDEIKYPEKNISIIRNPINFIERKIIKNNMNTKKIISIIGRLSGPKGEVAYNILKILCTNDYQNKYEIRVIGGKNIEEKFKVFLNQNINFLGYVDDIQEKILESDVVIGAGRVAIESILNEIPIIAVGESEYIGLVDENNLAMAKESNFGDIGNSKIPKIDKEILISDIEKSFNILLEEKRKIKTLLSKEVSLKEIVDKIEKKYHELFVKKRKYEIPIIMYHRVIDNKENEGIHGTYIYKNVFEKHMQYLKENNYDVISFKDFYRIGWRNRFLKNKKYIIITFDDGYEDNYKIAFPILKRYNFKATIFLMGTSKENEWDIKESGEKSFPLLTDEMILEMQNYGIEFGAHTLNHPRINKISNEEISYQISKSKEIIENKINSTVITFAYPYGILNEYAKKVVQNNNFVFAVATDSGPITLSDDFFQIRRIAIFPNTSLFKFKRKVKGNYNFLKIKRETKKGGIK